MSSLHFKAGVFGRCQCIVCGNLHQKSVYYEWIFVSMSLHFIMSLFSIA